MILGIDEVGRGPWAGPLVVGAVVLPDNFDLPGLTDSKKLSAKKRLEYDAIIREKSLGWGLGWVDSSELDELGLAAALKLATVRAVESVKTPYHEIIIDGTINFLNDTPKGRFVTVLPKADALIPAVSAASVIAKVARDTYMQQQAAVYPEYGFESHVGYGTAQHSQALIEYGVTPLHRRSFSPIAKLIALGNSNSADTPSVSSSKPDESLVTTKKIGDRAEAAVADYLGEEGYAVLERNWRTRYCEIDIIASKEGTLFFVEVKYRSSFSQGGGLAAITPQKLSKMRRGAEMYSVNSEVNRQLLVAVFDTNGRVKLIEVS